MRFWTATARAAMSRGAICACLLFSRPAAAQEMLGQAVFAHPYIGVVDLSRLYAFDDGTRIEQSDGMLTGVQAGFGITPELSILGNYATNSTMMYLKPQSGNTLGDAYHHDVLLWDVNLQLRRPFWHEKVLNPLLQFGAGQIRTTTSPGFAADEQDINTLVAYNVGLGIDVQVGNAFGIRLMGKDYVTTSAWQSTAAPRYNSGATEAMSQNVAYHIGITLGF